MKPLTDRLSVYFLLAVILAGCARQPEILAASAERVEINSIPDDFLWAFELARRECDRYQRLARYVPDTTDKLHMLVFDCIDPTTEIDEQAAEQIEEATDSNTE